MVEENEKIQAAYDKGVLDQRLNAFDSHFTSINGSVERTATELNKLRLAIEEQLALKTDRSRFHELLGKVDALRIQLVAFEQTVVKREGPIVDRVDRNTHRLDLLESGQMVAILRLKEELIEAQQEIKEELIEGQQALRVEVIKTQFMGSFRRAAAAGSSFAVAFGIVLAAAHSLGWT